MASDRLRRNPQEKTVILDSSAILMLFEFSIDLEEELRRLLGIYHIVVPSLIIRELEKLSKSGDGKKKSKAEASLKLIEKYDIVEVQAQNADDAVFELAKETNGIVVTNDRALRNRLKEISLSVIFLRSKKQLVKE